MRSVLLTLLLSSTAAFAHHSMAAVYDDNKLVILQGTVTKFDWANPHVWLFVETAEGHWAVEFPSRAELRQSGQTIVQAPANGQLQLGAARPGGWNPEAFHIGDEISFAGRPARDGSLKAQGLQVTLASGMVLSGTTAPRSGFEGQRSGTIPRTTDGHPLLGPAAGQSGYWLMLGGNITASTDLAMNRDGLLRNLADASKVAPLQPWALALYRYRQETKLKDDPMAACLPPGGPRQFQDPLGVQFLVQPDRQRIMIMSNGANRNWRMIHMDGRVLPKGEDVTPTYYGYSVGRWEGDTLVVDSTGYVERFWFANGGLPHTEGLRLTERFTRLDSGTLRYEVTVDDPGAYTQPWTARLQLEWIDNDLQDEYFCDDYNREELK